MPCILTLFAEIVVPESLMQTYVCTVHVHWILCIEASSPYHWY